MLACGTRHGRGEILLVFGIGGRMGLALLALIWLITLVSTYFFVAKTWWLPVGASAATGFIDGQFTLTFILMGVVFLAAQLGAGGHRFLVRRPRDRNRPPPHP